MDYAPCPPWDGLNRSADYAPLPPPFPPMVWSECGGSKIEKTIGFVRFSAWNLQKPLVLEGFRECGGSKIEKTIGFIRFLTQWRVSEIFELARCPPTFPQGGGCAP